MRRSISLDDELSHPLDELCKCPRCLEWASKQLKTCSLDPIGEDPCTFLGKAVKKNVALLFEEQEDGFVSSMIITDLSTGNRVAVYFAAPAGKSPPKPGPKTPQA